MDIPNIALAAGLAWASGLRLYVVLFLVGVAGYFGWTILPTHLEVLAHPLVLGTSGTLAVAEFFADKIPGFDSLWDAIHTFIRIPAGALLAAGAAGGLGEGSLPLMIAAGLIGGTITAGSHFTKAGTRVAINTSPEPFTNWFVSLAEDAFVIGLSLLTLNFPLLALLVSVTILVMIGWLARRVLRWLRPDAARNS